jgi:hypothetical protein
MPFARYGVIRPLFVHQFTMTMSQKEQTIFSEIQKSVRNKNDKKAQKIK